MLDRTIIVRDRLQLANGQSETREVSLPQKAIRFGFRNHLANSYRETSSAETNKLCARMNTTPYCDRSAPSSIARARRARPPAVLAFKAMALASLIAMLAASTQAITARVNFGQSNQSVAPTPADARRLSGYFSPPYKPGPLPPAVEQILLRYAPAELRAGCAAMVDSWEAAARSSSVVSLKILAVAGGGAWITYRCSSRMPQLEGNYSERLAAFNGTRGTIQFLDLKANEDTAATLYHIGLNTTLKLHGAENSASFVVFATSFNRAVASAGREDSAEQAPERPASQGRKNRATANGQAENRIAIVANSAVGAKLVLSLVVARKRPGAQVGENAHAVEMDDYRAGVRYEHDLSGYLTAVSTYYRDSPTGGRPRFGALRYVWRPGSLSFAAPQPVEPPTPRWRRDQLPSEPLRPHPRPVPFERLPPVPGYHPGSRRASDR